MTPTRTTVRAMEFETITYDVQDRVGRLHFDRPEGANAVSPTFARELREAMLHIHYDDSVKSVAVTAEGKVFCAGGDLKLFHAWGDQMARNAHDMLIDFHAAIHMMNHTPKPFVAGVRGAAGGAGMSLMSAFDLVVSGESAKYTMAYTRAGVTPDGTSSYFVTRHIGLRRMLDLTLTNRVLSAEEAESWGLVNRVVADDDVDTATVELATTLRRAPRRRWGSQAGGLQRHRRHARDRRRVRGGDDHQGDGERRRARRGRRLRRETGPRVRVIRRADW